MAGLEAAAPTSGPPAPRGPKPVTRGRWEAPSRATARRVLVDQAVWLALAGLAWAVFAAFQLPAQPLAAGLALGLGAVGMRPRLALLAPAVLALTAGAALGAHALEQSPWMGAGLAAGSLGALLRLPEGERTALTGVNGGLAGAAAAGLGAWVADRAGLAGGLAEGLVVGLFAAQGLWASVLRWRELAAVPGADEVRATLGEAYTRPPLRALELFLPLRSAPHDPDTLEGLAEVCAWVYQLGLSLQTLDQALEAAPLAELAERLAQAAEEAERTEDPFIRERRLATAAHLQQLMRHVEQLRLERQRTASLQDYALAYLEEARLGLLLARSLPGEATPVRLDEVLNRLRTHAREGDARRRTARELTALRG